MHSREHHHHEEDDFWTKYSRLWEFIATWLTSSYWMRDIIADFADNPEIKENLPIIILSNLVALWAAYGASHCHGNINLAHQEKNSISEEEADEEKGEDDELIHSAANEEKENHHEHHHENRVLYFLQLGGDYFAHTSGFAAPINFIIQLSSGPTSYNSRMLTNLFSLTIAGMASVAEVRTCKNVKDQLAITDLISSHQPINLSKIPRTVFELPKPDFWSIFNGITESSTNLVNIGYWAGSLIDGFFNLSPYIFQLSQPALIVGVITTTIAGGAAYNHVKLAATYQKKHDHEVGEQKSEPLTLIQKLSRPGDVLSHVTDAVAPGTFLLELHTPYRAMPRYGKALCLLGVFAVGAPAAVANTRTCRTNLERYNYKVKVLEDAGLQNRPPSL